MRNQDYFNRIVVAIAIIGFMQPLLYLIFWPTAAAERKSFVAKLNDYYFGWQQALITHKIHAIDLIFPQTGFIESTGKTYERLCRLK